VSVVRLGPVSGAQQIGPAAALRRNRRVRSRDDEDSQRQGRAEDDEGSADGEADGDGAVHIDVLA
jgi:hypothetical protein